MKYIQNNGVYLTVFTHFIECNGLVTVFTNLYSAFSNHGIL